MNDSIIDNNDNSFNDIESANRNIAEQNTAVAKLTALFTGTITSLMYDETTNDDDNNNNNKSNTSNDSTVDIIFDNGKHEPKSINDNDNTIDDNNNNNKNISTVDNHHIWNDNYNQRNKVMAHTSTSYNDMPTNCTGIILSKDEYDTLQPCRTRNEILRDKILFILDNKYFSVINTIVLLLIIADGALFFFLLIGLHRMCSNLNNNNNNNDNNNENDECHPRNYWYNWSIQVLNILFTYMVTTSLPWRCIQLYHTIGTNTNNSKSCCCCIVPIKRTNTIGYNLYGIYCNNIWYYIPLQQRKYIIILLLFNAICQYINQGTRIVHYKYVHQDTYPGYIWTNVFFGLSFIFAFISLIWILYEYYKIRHNTIFINDSIKITNNVVGTDNDTTRNTTGNCFTKFGPGPIDSLKYVVSNLVSKKIQTKKPTGE